MNLCEMSADEIMDLIGPEGFGRDSALSVANSVYKKRITEIRDFPKISKRLRNILEERVSTGLSGPLEEKRSRDGTVKYLFINEAGQKYETVFIPGEKRRTLCISSQSGCRIGCRYCATGSYGFYGNLQVRDIMNQVLGIPGVNDLTHIVFMGMGEPLDNIDNVLKACEIITAEWGPAISSRNVTVSTIGLTGAIEKFLERTDCNIALSLYSPFPGERIKVIPSERLNPSERILEIMKSGPFRKKRRMSVAYMMIDGVNDSPEHLGELKRILKGSNIRVNLLPYHPIRDDGTSPSPEGRMQDFKHELIMSGISASLRRSRGKDISAACGLLASGLKE